MISYDKAITIIREQGAKMRLGSETIGLTEIAGRVCAVAVKSPRTNQPFDNSAMDGFAIHADDLAQAANDNPVILEMAGRIAAGDAPLSRPLLRGQCYEIMTGAPLPPGCDSVVPVEKTQTEKQDGILFKAPAGIGDHIRRAGDDFAVGDPVLEPGMMLKTSHILPLATLGIGTIEVLRRPKAAVISTGLEIIDDLSAPLNPGQIYNATRPYLRTALPEFGMVCQSCDTVGDDAAAYQRIVQKAIDQGSDIIISTGAVSAGVHDFVPDVLRQMGAEILFHKVAMRPGRPNLFARFPGGTFFFGLPGNPVSTAAGLRFFVDPLVRAMQGLEPEIPHYVSLTKSFRPHEELCLFLRAAVRGENVEILPKQQSFMVSPFSKANGWVVIPEGGEAIQAGDTVAVFSMHPAGDVA